MRHKKLKLSTLLLLGIGLTGLHAQNTLTVTDIDGNVYQTVSIGTQVWMKENLKVTRYRNGDVIGTTTPATLDVSGESTPKYQWAYNGDERNVAAYGRLYTWYAVTDSRNVCPTGWHIPTDAEWTTLTDYLGGAKIAGGKLKETGTAHWQSPNTGATNETGFTALPGSYRSISGEFSHFGNYGGWWSSSEFNAYMAWPRYMTGIVSYIGRYGYGKSIGFSVRCLKD
ncbi:MAG: fibrobacter succinogenes major paralogous domain-containing protein [Bacteroidota bacterium]|nr:fibrobacter succinogenes major paralogous domain-containing protein [Bacteroidota bacterium]